MFKNKKYIIITILIIVVLLVESLSLITGYTLVLPISREIKDSTNYSMLKKNDRISILKNFDFTKGNWKACIIISPDDFKNLDSSIPKVTFLKTSDKTLLQEMKRKWTFTYTGGDMATVESGIYFYCDNKLVFESGIVLDKRSEGLQSKKFGWLEPVEPKALSNICKRFNVSVRPTHLASKYLMV